MPCKPNKSVRALAVIVALGLTAPALRSQVSPAAAAAGPAVNDMAPDFALRGSTRFGPLRDPVRLSDFRGRTVVLAFFSQARTKG